MPWLAAELASQGGALKWQMVNWDTGLGRVPLCNAPPFFSLSDVERGKGA